MLSAVLFFFIGVVFAGNSGHHHVHSPHDPPNGHDCISEYDCPYEQCYRAECLIDGCSYSRLPIDECCLNSDECCAFASEHEVGICDKNCTCQLLPSCRTQCVVDADCDALRSGMQCRSMGECHVSVCEAEGWCECVNATGQDWDQDGVPCPEDCDDLDFEVSHTITCYRDKDNDHYHECPVLLVGRRHHDDDDDSDNDDDDDVKCMEFCISPNATCPRGWTDPSDPERFDKPRSHINEGMPCANQTIPQNDDCDCCDIDRRAHPGSVYVSNRPNKCGNSDYNCDDTSDEYLCCDEGHKDYYSHNNRYLWYEQDCIMPPPTECGGCETNGTEPVLVIGWACETNCSALTTISIAHNQHQPDDDLGCPEACGGECACIDGTSDPLPVGQCAKVVNACIEVRPDVYGDREECCIVTVR